MEKQPERISLPTELVNRVVGYLASKPFAEVHELINGMQRQAKPCTSCEEPKPE